MLKDVSCEICRGDFVALTGISGGGKTSLFQLLLGMFVPVSGRICFETGAAELPASRATRALFAYVPQGNTLISGSLRENLTLFSGEMPDERLLQAADTACVGDLIR